MPKSRWGASMQTRSCPAPRRAPPSAPDTHLGRRAHRAGAAGGGGAHLGPLLYALGGMGVRLLCGATGAKQGVLLGVWVWVWGKEWKEW